MTQTTDAALVPEDVRALRVQNGALRTLNRCLEAEIKQHRARAQEYHAASQTLDSEREANRILTDTIEAQARRIEALEGALRPMSEAPRDRFILAMYRSVDGHRAHMDGRVFTVRHEGKTVSDFDLGWALYPGYGGVPDVSFYGWMDMPAALAKAPTP